jgi:predicted transposase/invertase (TIGR01784 family)
MFFLKNPELIPEEFITKVPEVHEALEELKVMSMDKKFRAAYRAHIRAQNDQTSREASAEARGRADGELKGKAEGIAEGELKKARETARAMLADGVPADTVSKYTGLGVDEIKAIN